MTVATIATQEGLGALAPAWRDLWERSGATPFQHPAFVLGWWDAFHPGRIEAAGFFRDETLCALAPFYREHETNRLLIMGMGVGDYLDAIAERDAETCAALRAFIAAAEPPISLEDLPPFSVLADADVQRHRICPVSDLAKPIPSSMRRGLVLARNRIARRGSWEVIRATAPVPPDLLARLASMHRARQTSLARGSIFDDPRVMALIARLANDADFPMRVYEARIGGTPAAHAVTLHDARGVYFWLVTMATEFAFESPAKRLIGEIRDEAIAGGLGRMFWLRGDEPYKQAWGASPDWSYALRREAVVPGLQERA